jgi:hypothetical protein
MTFTVQLIIDPDGSESDGVDGEPIAQETIEIALLEREDDPREDNLSLEDLGLSLAESKEILQELQREIVQRQAESYAASRRGCLGCGKRRRRKGHYPVQFRSLFGNVELKSPRLYHCDCRPREQKTFSPLTQLMPEHTAPELLYLETKWASLAPYAKVADLLKDVLPVSSTTNAATIRNHLQMVAERDEAELGEERFSFAEECSADWATLPRPDGPITVGIDGGYVRNWGDKKNHFEVIAGMSIPRDGPAKRFAFASEYDQKPKRRLFEVLRAQGLQMNQRVTFLSDGADSVRTLQLYMSPQARHILDWFHLTMPLTVLGQYAKGLVRLDEDIGTDVQSALKSTKWYLWHDNVYEALLELDIAEMLVWNFEDTYPEFVKLERAVRDFQTYVENNRELIPNYGERYRYGERISTGFVESTINQVVAKRFSKRQLQWTPRGAHLLLQTRTRVLNGELVSRFRRWYPNFRAGEKGDSGGLGDDPLYRLAA